MRLKGDAAANIRKKDSFRYILAVEGIIIGLITGAVISVFRLMLIYADSLRDRMVTYADSGVAPALICALVIIVIALIVSCLLGLEPDIAGSGIPQVEAELRGMKDMKWYRVIPAKAAGCALAIGAGLALGREGPSIQLGAMTGKGFSRLRHRLLTEERLLITCGAGAGLSAAFGAPLAGALFTLEELHRNFSAEILLSAMAASAASEFVAANIFGLTPVFGFDAEHALPLSCYWAVIILGLLLGVFGMVYNRTIEAMQDLFDRIGMLFARAASHIPGVRAFDLTDSKLTEQGMTASRTGRLLTIFVCAYILMFCYPEALGSGSGLVREIAEGRYALGALVLLLAVKFVFSTACFGSGSPGGIFLPLLVLGAAAGGLFSRVLGLAGFDQRYIAAFVVVAMAGYFSAVVRAPVTGVILITEMTGDFTCLLPLVLTSLISYVTAELLGVEPIYTQLLHRSRRAPLRSATRRPAGRRPAAKGDAKGAANGASAQTAAAKSALAKADALRTTASKGASAQADAGKGASSRKPGRMLLRERKVIIDADVHIGSYMDGRRVMDFGLPVGTLIVSVIRDDTEIIPDGHTILRGGDALEILTREQDIRDAEDIIEEKCHVVV